MKIDFQISVIYVDRDFFVDWDGKWEIYETNGRGDAEELHGHRVTVIGYGMERNEQYYVIKNSAGTDWGQGGYGRIRASRTYGGQTSNAYSAK